MSYLYPGGKFDGKGEWVSNCPACGRRNKFYWNPSDRKGLCFSTLCGVSVSSEMAYIKLCNGSLEYTSAIVSKPRVVSTEDRAKPQRLTSKTVCAWDFPKSKAFLSAPLDSGGRGLSEEVVRSVPIGGDGQKIWVTLDPASPEYDPVLFERPADGSKPWLPSGLGINKLAYCFGLKAWLESGRSSVVIMEGVFDVLGTGLYGSAIAIMGSNFSDVLADYLANHVGRPIDCYYWPDPDEAGYVCARKAVKKLKGWGLGCQVVGVGLNPKYTSPEDARELLTRVGWS